MFIFGSTYQHIANTHLYRTRKKTQTRPQSLYSILMTTNTLSIQTIAPLVKDTKVITVLASWLVKPCESLQQMYRSVVIQQHLPKHMVGKDLPEKTDEKGERDWSTEGRDERMWKLTKKSERSQHTYRWPNGTSLLPGPSLFKQSSIVKGWIETEMVKCCFPQLKPEFTGLWTNAVCTQIVLC